jgi:catecholate siderophore receptor
MNRDEGSWRENLANGDEPEVHRQGAAISLALNQNSHNRFWLNHYYLKTRDNPDYGMSFDGVTRRPNERFPARAYWGTDKTFDDSDTTASRRWSTNISSTPNRCCARRSVLPTISAATGRRRRT